MAGPNAPWLDDPIVGGAPTASSSTPTADAPWASDPIVSNAAAAQKAPLTQDDINNHLLSLLNDPKVSGRQIRDYYTSLGGQLSEHDSKAIDDRDTYIAANHATPTIGVDATGAGPAQAPNLVDNRPYSFMEGVRQGDQHVLSNVAGGAGWVANKLGYDNDWGGDARSYFHNLEAPEPTQGSSAGKLTGEVIATAPVAMVAPEGELGILARGAIMAGEGATQGALTTNATTPGGVAKDATIGAILGAGLGGAANGLAHVAATPTAASLAGRQILDAADRLSRDGLAVSPLPADVGGGFIRNLTSGVDAGVLSNGPIANAARNYLDAAQAARDRAAGMFIGGQAPQSINAVAGDVLNGAGGLGDYAQRSGDAVRQAYEDAATLTGDTQIPAPQTLQALNDLIAQREAIPGNVAGLDALRSLRTDLTPTPDQVIRPSLWDRIVNGARTQTIPGDPAAYAIDSLRRLRTSFGDNFDANQRAAREAANTLWGPLSEDIQAGLRGAGREDAADAYRAADQAYATRQANLDNIVNPIVGNRSGEQLANQLVNLSRSNSDLLNNGLDLMHPDQANNVRAAIVNDLGRANSGAQNAAGDGFSMNTFLSHWDKLSDGTKATMLTGQAGDDIRDLATLAEGARNAGRYRNTSGTARATDALSMLKSLFSSAGAPTVGGIVGGPVGAATGAAAQYGVGSLLASPVVGRALVRMGEIRPATNTAALLARLSQLSGPVISNGAPDDQ